MADLYIHNARIWTGNRSQPWADAALIRNGRFAFVGRAQDANADAGVAAFDARGRLVLPGFIDGHAHLLGTGAAMRAVALKGVPSVDEAARRVANRAASTAPGGWIRGAGWDQNDWPGAAFPDRHALDAAAPEHPVVLTHTSGHCTWVNSAALRAAGVTRDTEAPVGGAIDVDADGEPTGILRDTASKLVNAVVPSPTPDERIAAFADAVAHAHSLGVTGAHAMDVGRGEYQAMLALRDSGRLRFRVRAFMTAERLDEWFERNLHTGDGDDIVRVGGVKFFADGALGSMTAWMREPYEDSDDVGLALQSAEVLEERVRQCLARGLAPAIHAIGDRANKTVLDILERARDLAPELPRRIEHAQLVTADDIPRFGTLGVTASAQPIHATQDMAKVDRSWGERGRTAYAFVSLQASGANLAFGSDTPVETMDPIAGVHAAVTRRRADGEPPGGWYPEQRLQIERALEAYGAGCARATGEDDRVGTIGSGYLADCVVLSHDLFSVDDPMEMLTAQVDATIAGGEVVYAREGLG